MSVDISDLSPVLDPTLEPTPLYLVRTSRTKRYKNVIIMVVLFLINLLNYMDRFAIAAVLEQIKKSFSISDAQGGLLQTVFVCSYMVLAPLFGYLGDRYSRKLMMLIGLTLWSLMTLAGSFVPDHLFPVFVVLRCLVGVGEASYSCVAPTIIADLFKHNLRTTMLAIFNIAIPLGGGLGYIVGDNITKAFHGEWRWALRVTPALGLVCIVLLVVLVEEPARGSSDGAVISRRTSWLTDVLQIVRVKSFIWTTLGFTWVAFALGSLAWWSPTFLKNSYELQGKNAEYVNLYFGIITCVGGLLGVFLGTEVAKRCRRRSERADPIVCGVAILLAVPFLIVVLLLAKSNYLLTWIFIFVTQTLLSTNWALISDMLMYIIIPTRRSTASSIQIFVLHLLGDASSPYIVGQTSDFFSKGDKDLLIQWTSLRNGMLLTPCVAAMGGVAFLIASIFIVRDRGQAEVATLAMEASDNFGMAEKISK